MHIYYVLHIINIVMYNIHMFSLEITNWSCLSSSFHELGTISGIRPFDAAAADPLLARGGRVAGVAGVAGAAGVARRVERVEVPGVPSNDPRSKA